MCDLCFLSGIPIVTEFFLLDSNGKKKWQDPLSYIWRCLPAGMCHVVLKSPPQGFLLLCVLQGGGCVV